MFRSTGYRHLGENLNLFHSPLYRSFPTSLLTVHHWCVCLFAYLLDRPTPPCFPFPDSLDSCTLYFSFHSNCLVLYWKDNSIHFPPSLYHNHFWKSIWNRQTDTVPVCPHYIMCHIYHRLTSHYRYNRLGLYILLNCNKRILNSCQKKKFLKSMLVV